VLTVAAVGGILDQFDYPSDFKMGVDNKSEWYLTNVNPTGQVPSMKTPEGFLFESNAMTFYLATKVGKGLMGNTPFEGGQIVQWLDFYNNWIKVPLSTWYYPYNGWAAFDEAKEKDAIAQLKGAGGRDPLGILNRQIGTKSFIIGDHLTVADIIIWVGLLRLFTQVAAPEFFADLPNLLRWGKEMSVNPFVKAGNYNKDTVFATKAPELPAPKQ
jgi:elongation factor 1-gamma